MLRLHVLLCWVFFRKILIRRTVLEKEAVRMVYFSFLLVSGKPISLCWILRYCTSLTDLLQSASQTHYPWLCYLMFVQWISPRSRVVVSLIIVTNKSPMFELNFCPLLKPDQTKLFQIRSRALREDICNCFVFISGVSLKKLIKPNLKALNILIRC